MSKLITPKKFIDAYTCSMGLKFIKNKGRQPLQVFSTIKQARAELNCLDECDIIKIRIEKVRKVKI